MGTMTLVVDRRGSSLLMKQKGVVTLEHPDGAGERVGLAALGGIVAVGESLISTGLLRACAEAGVSVALLPGRGPGSGAVILPGPRGRVARRVRQYRLCHSQEGRLRVARRLVAAKISGQRDWLREHNIDTDMERFLGAALQAPDLHSLMGAEGAAAARYFELWPRIWGSEWGFVGRNRRPPRDPVNALISLGYTLAGAYVGRQATAFGLDPVFGFLHRTDSSRSALMLDLLEPLRPTVDRRVWEIVRDWGLTPRDFTHDPELGCRLGKDGRDVFFRDWFIGEQSSLNPPARHALAVVLNEVRHEPIGIDGLDDRGVTS